MLDGPFASIYGDSVTPVAFLITAAVTFALGALIALLHRKTSPASSGSMSVALVCLPFLVHLVILVVNGNLGAGVAVMGAFSLVRFRSAPGSAQDIATIFLAMAVGLACGMGYVLLAVFAALAMGAVCLLLSAFSGAAADAGEREVRVTVPENLDYTGLFDDLFQTYAAEAKLVRVKTVNMGSLYALHYHIRLKEPSQEKELLDQMRCRNGNLEISCGITSSGREKERL